MTSTKMVSTRFKDKSALVTGAAQGIGKGIAEGLASEGAIVILVDKSPLVEEVAQKINESGGIASAFVADLESYYGAEEMVRFALERYQKIDILINNIGGAIWMKPFDQFTEGEITREIYRSLFPTLWSCRAVIPEMVKQKNGTIVNISSVATRGILRGPYSAAKGGVNALTASLAFEYADRGIRVNAIATGGTEAPPRAIPRNENPLTADEEGWMQEVVDQTIDSTYFKRYGVIEEQVRVALFLASEESSYITATVIPVAGGDQGL